MAPFLAAVAAFALSTGGFLAAFGAFLLFAAVMGMLMVAISVLVGASQNALLRRLRTHAREIQRVGSVLMMGVGIGLISFVIV